MVAGLSHKPDFFELDCDDLRRELSDYLEDDLTEEMRVRIANHLRNCRRCTAVYDGLQNVVELLANERSIELPKGFSQRLYRRLLQ
jgi:predicted anti-sigma-YlaC factor YlaD